MEPKSPEPSRGPELPSVVAPAAGEMVGSFSTPEFYTGNTIERQEQRAESAPAAGTSAAQAPILPIPVVTDVPNDDQQGATSQVTNSSPTVANDDELIEREWVDKAKKVIAETKDDPYVREQRVSQLQADYLWKRYGRQLKSPQ